MKDNLFELLLNLFEKSLSQLHDDETADLNLISSDDEQELVPDEAQSMLFQSAQDLSTRIFTYSEQIKITKKSYQFIMRMKSLEIFDNNLFEIIMHQIHFSESRVVTLEETKWTIRKVLAPLLDENQLAFLDLVLYQKEDNLSIH